MKDTANQGEEETGEIGGWKGRKERWGVEEEQGASIDCVK